MSDTIAVLGGTGKEARGLIRRLIKANYDVVVGSRKQDKADGVVADLEEARPEGAKGALRGATNVEAAGAATRFVVMTIPFAGHAATLSDEALQRAMAGKILVDCTVPLDPDDPTRVIMPEDGSATEEAQRLLGDNIAVVAAFQNASAPSLNKVDDPLHTDVLVCGDDPDACGEVIALVEQIGGRGFYVGPAEAARCVEALTPILIRLAIAHKARGGTGIHITGV